MPGVGGGFRVAFSWWGLGGEVWGLGLVRACDITLFVN
jgi:hypothetical protein